MMMKLPLWMFLLLCVTTFFTPYANAEIKNICFNKTEVIECPQGSKITIQNAEYGRKNRTVCDDDVSWFIWCPMQSASKHVGDKCNNQKDCYLTTKLGELELDEEENCEHVRYKYLEIEYSCSGSPTTPKPPTPTKAPEVLVPSSTNNFERICEFDKGSIKCGINQKIRITKIFWGRQNNTEDCHTHWYKDTGVERCSQSNDLEKTDLLNSIRQYCNNEEQCNFLKPKWYLKHPCPGKEISKYLEITYDCMTEATPTTVTPTGPPMTETICQNSTLEVSCKNGNVIKILNAWYGFDPNATNKCGLNETEKCGVDGVRPLSILCGNSRGCQITALDDRFPTSNCTKANTGFITLSYQCIAYAGGKVPQVTKPPYTKPPVPNEADIQSRILSDGMGSLLWCGESIYIKEALYGNSDNNCVINITNILEHDCEGYGFCQLSSSIGAYGDPKCPEGVTRRMEIKYWCGVKAPTGSPPTLDVPDASPGAKSIHVNDRNCGKPKLTRTGRVLNGVTAAPGRWPWQAELYSKSFAHICGGSLISSEWIVSAAHCIGETEVTKTNNYFVVLGEFDRTKKEGTEFRYNITKIIRHPLYGADGQVVHDNDIMLLKITPEVNMTDYIRTVCLPDPSETDDLYYQDCFLTGWGKPTHPGRSAYILQQGMLQPVNNTECNRKLKNALGEPDGRITNNMLCATDRLNIGIGGCQGDSGGPFVCRRKDNNAWYLRGAVSWGSERCNIKDMYQVLVKVSSFTQWINDRIREN